MTARFQLAALVGLAFSVVAADPVPTQTPTARPRLSGGFGRPAATPIAADPGGQALSDVVRAAEQGRTRKEQKPGVSITNKSLVTDPNKGNLTTSKPKGVPVSTTVIATPSPSRELEATPAAGEAEWKERARRARQHVEDGKAHVYQLEGEAAALEKDFYRWDDGQYRDGVIKPAWDRKRAELEAARIDLAEAEKDLADLPEQARKAGALPGWIRE
jgi:hypothetical protein